MTISHYLMAGFHKGISNSDRRRSPSLHPERAVARPFVGGGGTSEEPPGEQSKFHRFHGT